MRWTHRAAVVLVLAGAGGAPAATVELRVADTTVHAGEPLIVHLEVSGFRECGPPEFPHLPGAAVQLLPVNADRIEVTIVNGRAREVRSRTYSYEVVPREPGTLRIPSLSVEVDGRTQRTKPLEITVLPADQQELLLAEISAEGVERAYVGQQVRLKLSIWIRPAQAFGQWLSMEEMYRLLAGSSFGPFAGQRIAADQRRRRGADGRPQVYYVYEAETDYVPARPGPLEVPDVEISLRYPTRFGRTIFGDLTITGERRLRAVPAVARVEVLPLPSEGQPPGFRGAVGRYEIYTSAQPASVRVGDPIELTIEIGGEGPVASLLPPDLTQQPQLVADFRVPDEPLTGTVVGRRRRFTQVIRALREDVREIPSIEYPYFDPWTGQYRVARSHPIPIHVAPVEKLPLDALGAPPAPAPAAEPEPPPADVLRGLKTDEAALLSSATPVTAARVVVAAAAPAAIFGANWLLLTLHRLRAGNAAARRRRGALRQARRRIGQASSGTAELPRAVQAALAGYLADRFDRPVGQTFGLGGIQLLRERGAREESVARCEALLRRCQEYVYSGQGADVSDALRDEALACLEQLEQERL